MQTVKIKRILKNILCSAYSLFLLLFDTLFLVLFRGKNEETKSKKRILVVKLDAIGDFVLWLNSAKALKTLFSPSNYTIFLLGNKAWTPLSKKLPYFDEVWPLDRRKFTRNLFYRFKMLKKIRHGSFAMVIQPTFSREFSHGDAIVRLSDANEKIGSHGDYSNIRKWQKSISDRWYSRLIPATKEPLMELERNVEFMRGLGLIDLRSDIPRLPASVLVPVNLNVKEYYILFPGAGENLRQWPLQNFMEIARRVYRSTGWTGIVCGGPGEESLGKDLEHNLDIPHQNLVGRTSLQELISIIAGAQGLISNETSAVHIAASLSTPSVCILGGGHFGRFMPYPMSLKTGQAPIAVIHEMACFGCNWRCIYAVPKGQAVPCIINISINEVWEQVQTVLNNKKRVKQHSISLKMSD